ncbi:MAG TPA: hypothetical protein VM120_07605 [Bryobacteraceae bacterium]|nr:hypothetical protein [Bryobacteraceae bacterium]
MDKTVAVGAVETGAQRSTDWTSQSFWDMGLHKLQGAVRDPSHAT